MSDSKPTLRVMSFNIRTGGADDGLDSWHHRADMCQQTMKAYNPDLLCVQEAVGRQVKALKENFTDYTYIGAGRIDGKDAGESVPILARKDRLEVVDSGHFWLCEPCDAPVMGWDAHYVRITTWARLRDKQDGRDFLLMSTHLDNRGRVAQVESIGVIRKQCQKLGAGLPVLFIGDFNIDDDWPAYAAVVDPNGTPRFSDSWRELHPERRAEGEATFHSFKGSRIGRRIDYVFHTPEFRATKADIDYTCVNGHYPSDHFPITVEVVRV